MIDNTHTTLSIALGCVELEILKTYIKKNLANDIIKPSKSTVEAPILFDKKPILFNKKPDGSLRLYMDYQGLNNLTIKNRYPLLFVGKSLDQLSRVDISVSST